MSTPVIERLVVEILTEHLDEDWIVPCERALLAGKALAKGHIWALESHCHGANPAEWVLWCACACKPNSRLYCTRCKDLVLSYPLTTCPGCDTSYSPASTAYRLIEPLNRRTT